MEVKKFEDPSGNVWKYVFHFEDAIAEAVLYRYGSFKERTVMCVSVQSGCPVGCTFCGTGKKFIRNLTKREIVSQVEYLTNEVIKSNELLEGIFPEVCNKFQIMFMSMGEPMLNFDEVGLSIYYLADTFPNAQLLLSTIGIKDRSVLNDIINISRDINKVGLQFSIHDAIDSSIYDKETGYSSTSPRDVIIPFKNKLNLRQIRDYGIIWYRTTSRQVYLNYCLHKDNNWNLHINRLMDLFPPKIFAFTFSAICEKEEGKVSVDNTEDLLEFQKVFLEAGYNVRVFDPAGCGQLWYVQDYFKQGAKD